MSDHAGRKLFSRGRQRELTAHEHAVWERDAKIAQLEQTGRELRRILSSLGEGVIAVDGAGIVVHANPAAIALLELDPDVCIGSHMYVAIGHQAACDALDEVMRAPQLDAGEGRALTRARAVREINIDDGVASRTMVVTVRPLRTEEMNGGDGAVEGAIAVVRDVTELRRLERARQDFFANVSHELKTPITAIRGTVETMLDDPAMPDDVRDRFLRSAFTHAGRLSALVTDLLALARLERDPGALAKTSVDLVKVARDVCDAVALPAEQRGVGVQFDIDRELNGSACVEGDEESLRQAIANLVDNAVAYSDSGDIVQVAIRAAGPSALECAVIDEGAGIPVSARDRVFERFYRVDADRSRERGGTGIGLSIVKHVALSHRGTVELESVEGVGSTFRLRLPRAEPRSSSSDGMSS